MKIKYIYDNGIIWPPEVFLQGIPNRLLVNAVSIAWLSQIVNVPTEASIGYSITYGFRILLALSKAAGTEIILNAD